jgi:LysM repeat protein
MNKRMLKNIVKSNFTCTFALIGLVMFIGGCATPKMLDSRGSIPPATLVPPGDANEIANNMPNDNADITLPLVATEEITISQDTIQLGDFSEFPEVKTETIMYKVKKGDSFWKIARMYGVGMKELAAFNKMDLKKSLNAGEIIEIPPGGKLISEDELAPIKPQKTVKASSTVKTSSIAKDGTYTVKPGDSLWLIARRNNTTVAKISKANDINKNAPLKVGQKLVLPEGSKAVKTINTDKKVLVADKPKKIAPLSKADNDLLNDLIGSTEEAHTSKSSSPLDIATDNFLPHTIKEGDTWNTISNMYGVSIANLKKANPEIASNKEPKINSVINIPEE